MFPVQETSKMSVLDCRNVIVTCPEVAEKLERQEICLIPTPVGSEIQILVCLMKACSFFLQS